MNSEDLLGCLRGFLDSEMCEQSEASQYRVDHPGDLAGQRLHRFEGCMLANLCNTVRRSECAATHWLDHWLERCHRGDHLIQ